MNRIYQTKSSPIYFLFLFWTSVLRIILLLESCLFLLFECRNNSTFSNVERVCCLRLSLKLQEVFTLHDGPPYANGDLHIGHALNKILKDFINRYQVCLRIRLHVRTGTKLWECLFSCGNVLCLVEAIMRHVKNALRYALDRL